MKKTALLLLCAVLLITLTGCGKYTSGYKAVAIVRSNTADSASMSFYSLEGRMVFRLNSSFDGQLRYTAKLENGSACVYYDVDGEKRELFSIGAGESVDSSGGYIKKGTVYIIVETDGKCQNGAFSFRLERTQDQQAHSNGIAAGRAISDADCASVIQ